VCHQSVSLTARHLEEFGIATVVIGSAMDIVTHCNVPRYLHNDLPLGNPLGSPGDRETQLESVLSALQLAISAEHSVVQVSDAAWKGDGQWKENYNKVDQSNRQALLRLGQENRKKRAENKARGLAR